MAKRASTTKARTTLSDPAAHRLVALVGKEDFIRSALTGQIRNALAKAHGEIDTIQFSGESAQLAEVLDEARSFGLVVTHKLIVIDDAQRLVNADTRPAWERYADDPSPDATVVLRDESWSSTGKFEKAVREQHAWVACEPLTPSEAGAWLVRRTKQQHGLLLTAHTAAALIDRLGTSLGRLAMEIDKLALEAQAEGRDEITPEQLGVMTAETRSDDQFWSIQAPILEEGPQAALRHLRVLMRTKGASVIPVSMACVDLAHKLHTSADAIARGERPEHAAKQAGLWGKLWPVYEAARNLPLDEARSLLHQAVQTDRAIKSGADQEIAVEAMIVSLSTALHRATGPAHKTARV